MVALVLAANLFADGVRDAFDPRARAFRPRLRRAATELMLTARGTAMLEIDELKVGARRRRRPGQGDRRHDAWRSRAARPSRWWANRAAARA